MEAVQVGSSSALEQPFASDPADLVIRSRLRLKSCTDSVQDSRRQIQKASLLILV